MNDMFGSVTVWRLKQITRYQIRKQAQLDPAIYFFIILKVVHSVHIMDAFHLTSIARYAIFADCWNFCRWRPIVATHLTIMIVD